MQSNPFIDRLKSYLAEHEIPEAKLAAKLGVSQATVNRWKQGTNRPAGTPAIKLARMLKMPLVEVMRGPIDSVSPAIEPAA